MDRVLRGGVVRAASDAQGAQSKGGAEVISLGAFIHATHSEEVLRELQCIAQDVAVAQGAKRAKQAAERAAAKKAAARERRVHPEEES